MEYQKVTNNGLFVYVKLIKGWVVSNNISAKTYQLQVDVLQSARIYLDPIITHQIITLKLLLSHQLLLSKVPLRLRYKLFPL